MEMVDRVIIEDRSMSARFGFDLRVENEESKYWNIRDLQDLEVDVNIGLFFFSCVGLVFWFCSDLGMVHIIWFCIAGCGFNAGCEFIFACIEASPLMKRIEMNGCC